MTPENRTKAVERLKPYQWKPGQTGNAGGRPKDTLKQYVSKKLCDMSPEEKEQFLRGIPKEVQWKMSEGNPPQSTELTGKDGEPITFKWED